MSEAGAGAWPRHRHRLSLTSAHDGAPGAIKHDGAPDAIKHGQHRKTPTLTAAAGTIRASRPYAAGRLGVSPVVMVTMHHQNVAGMLWKGFGSVHTHARTTSVAPF